MDNTNQNWNGSSQSKREPQRVYADRVIDARPNRSFKLLWIALIAIPAVYLLRMLVTSNLDNKSKELEQKQEQIATIIETRKELRLQMDSKITSIRNELNSLSGDVNTIKALNEQEEEIVKSIRDYERQGVAFNDYSDLFTKLRDELKLLVNDEVVKK